MSEFADINYVVEGSSAIVTIARPERYNAFRGQTIEELISAFRLAWADNSVRVIILTGEGEKAFCSGGDVKQRAETGDYGPTQSGLWEVNYFHKLIRDIPKPVIAAVNGVAIVGEKRAREIWYLCRQYDAATAERWGLVNAVVPQDQVLAEAKRWADEIAQLSPTAIKFLKHSFNTDTDHQGGISNMADAGLELFVESDEGREGALAFTEKREADFSRWAA